MSQIGNREALERLKALLGGDVVVEQDVFPRLVQALVRLSGKEGEELFGYHLRTAKISHMAAKLSAMSVMVLGARAVDILLDGVLSTVDLGRIRATTDVLGRLGTPEAHRALAEMARKVRHPVGKELAASRMEELERDHPTRFNLLPKLKELGDGDPAPLLAEFLAAEDREMVRLLVEEMQNLPPPAKALAYRVLAGKGDTAAARALQNRLGSDMPPETLDGFSLALFELIEKLPAALDGYEGEWREFWKRHGSREMPAMAAARALAAAQDPALVPTYAEFLESGFPEVRLTGYKALMATGDERHREIVAKGLDSISVDEVGAAAAALAVMGDPEPLTQLSKSKSAQRRTICATVCLSAGRRDLWGALALDDEKSVRHAAIAAMEEVSTDLRPSAEDLTPVISFTVDYESFEALCGMLGNHGDLEAAKRIASRLSEKDERITASALKALKAMRLRGIYRLDHLGEDSGLLIQTLADYATDQTALGLTGALIEDFDIEALEKIRDALLAQKMGGRQGGIQAVTMAVIGRILVLTNRKKVVDEIERAMAERPATAREQIESVNRIASYWLRADLDLNPVFSERIEDWMMAIAQDKTVARIARKSAIDAVGKGGSARTGSALIKLGSSPTEEISAAAQMALESLSRRFPGAALGAEDRQDSTRRHGILIVEDDANIRNVFQTYLFQKGFSAYGAGEGEEALGMLAEANVDLVLLDLHMPGMDGFRFLDALRKMRNPPPVVVITSYGDRNTVLKVLKLGAVDFLRKPVDLPEMLARVRKVTGGRADAN